MGALPKMRYLILTVPSHTIYVGTYNYQVKGLKNTIDDSLKGEGLMTESTRCAHAPEVVITLYLLIMVSLVLKCGLTLRRSKV